MIINKQIRIQSNNGPQILELLISFNHDDPDEVSKMTIKARFEGKEITAEGTQYPFEDAYADLQNKLPKSVKLAGCVTCRHGNLSPAGNGLDEVFCTKDVSITCKQDLLFYTENERETKRRSRTYTDFCDDYVSQEEDVFTYNDYLINLNHA
ncbi:MAG: hypothetical protein IJM69_05505 [Firmicutes bacterium]|nr:hypothetical protein [Bacillota bacterium]